MPLVVVLDQNLEVITRDAASDLLHFSPDACRSLWVQILKNRIEEQKREAEEN